MKIRNCAWLPSEQSGRKRVVWLRRDVRSEHCPKSVITPQSASYLELFAAWKQLGGLSLLEMEAKSADALSLLEQEWQKEKNYVETEESNRQNQ